jgi:multidrug efflux pump subunit AcrA (membrane-fusion protein)
VIRSSGPQVMVVERSANGGPAVVRLRPVQIARDYGNTVEIASGVTDGMTVVLNPGTEIMDGAKVRVSESRAP